MKHHSVTYEWFCSGWGQGEQRQQYSKKAFIFLNLDKSEKKIKNAHEKWPQKYIFLKKQLNVRNFQLYWCWQNVFIPPKIISGRTVMGCFLSSTRSTDLHGRSGVSSFFLAGKSHVSSNRRCHLVIRLLSYLGSNSTTLRSGWKVCGLLLYAVLCLKCASSLLARASSGSCSRLSLIFST